VGERNGCFEVSLRRGRTDAGARLRRGRAGRFGRTWRVFARSGRVLGHFGAQDTGGLGSSARGAWGTTSVAGVQAQGRGRVWAASGGLGRALGAGQGRGRGARLAWGACSVQGVAPGQARGRPDARCRGCEREAREERDKRDERRENGGGRESQGRVWRLEASRGAGLGLGKWALVGRLG
jgi:hypothetical protein